MTTEYCFSVYSVKGVGSRAMGSRQIVFVFWLSSVDRTQFSFRIEIRQFDHGGQLHTKDAACNLHYASAK